MNGKRSRQLGAWYLRHALNGVRSHHVTAIGLLSLWALVTAFIDYPLYVETRQLISQFDIRSAPIMKKPDSTGRKAPPRDIAKDFVASLPAFDNYPAQLRSLTQLSDKNGILVTRIDYRYANIPALPIRRLTLHLELRGGETQQRRLLQAALNTLPNLSIVRLSYTKGTDPGANVEEKLDVNLYYRLEKASA